MTSTTISKAKPQYTSMDYAALRTIGIAHLQKLAGKIWTDFNSHDPGVTLLENLCYAITDLGYRTSFDIKDILAEHPDGEATPVKSFYTAREILTCNPLTLNDYRKLIIDVVGIKNAWIEKADPFPPEFYADFRNDALTYTPPNGEAEPIYIKGLYDVVLEFEAHDSFGDLNDNSVSGLLEINTGKLSGLQVQVTVEFPYWDDAATDWERISSIEANLISIHTAVKALPEDYKVAITHGDGTEIITEVLDVSTSETKPVPGLQRWLKTAIKTFILGRANRPEGSLLATYLEKLQVIHGIISQVKSRLLAHRNLCEDFLQFRSLKVEEIGICADIELTAEADVEAVLGKIYYAIATFLAPTVRFHTLETLFDRGYTSDEIFEGPALDHGFIDTEELEAATRKKTIHVSDLIQLIMDLDVEGVLAVRNIQIANFPSDTADGILTKNAEWCLSLAYDQHYVPRLSTARSKIIFYKENIPFMPNKVEAKAVADELQAIDDDYWAIDPETLKLDLDIPKGTYREPENYFSLQHELPLVYYAGAEGLPPEASKLRKAQARQLKGYLLFFEQILANYLSQLANVKHLFSMNSAIDRTYFSQPLYEVPQVAHLLKDFIDSSGLEGDPDDDDRHAFQSSWETFKSDADNPYVKTLQELTETELEYDDRRNRFLDHLMARFGEQFTDYALMMYSIEGSKDSDELIADKLAMLNDYPEISSGRGQAYNYSDAENLWNSTNISGLQKRISRLLGIDKYQRITLTCQLPSAYFTIEKNADDAWQASMHDNAEQNWLLGTPQATEALAEQNRDQIIELGQQLGHWTLTEHEGSFGFKLSDEELLLATSSETYATARARNKALSLLVSYLDGSCDNEGFFLIEHVLLRPRQKDNDHFLEVNLDEECYCVGNEDPYSFRVSIVLPAWPKRFANMDFRRFFEKSIRLEAPAHVALKICWVNHEQMSAFEPVYRSWLETLAQPTFNSAEYTAKLNALIEVLSSLRNVYPEAHLHDCESSEGQNPVALDQTILGTYNPPDHE